MCVSPLFNVCWFKSFFTNALTTFADTQNEFQMGNCRVCGIYQENAAHARCCPVKPVSRCGLRVSNSLRALSLTCGKPDSLRHFNNIGMVNIAHTTDNSFVVWNYLSWHEKENNLEPKQPSKALQREKGETFRTHGIWDFCLRHLTTGRDYLGKSVFARTPTRVSSLDISRASNLAS